MKEQKKRGTKEGREEQMKKYIETKKGRERENKRKQQWKMEDNETQPRNEKNRLTKTQTLKDRGERQRSDGDSFV